MIDRLKLLRAFAQQIIDAVARQIDFQLDFDQWLKIWIDSEHLEDRGVGRDKYCMARNNDIGPYALGNVRIITNSENHREKVFTEVYRERLRKSRAGRVYTEATLAKMSASAKLRNPPTFKGKKHSAEAKRKMSLASFAREERKRRDRSQ